MPIRFAIRDSFGISDLIQDTKMTFRGSHYDYRHFDSGDNVIAHEESHSREARMMDGMRYERGGKGKYWIPKSQPDARTPLLPKDGTSRLAPESHGPALAYRAASPDFEIGIDAEDERLYTNARALEFGDWNYPVITAHEATREDWMNRDPGLLTTSTNRHLFQPTRDNKRRRKEEIRQSIHKGKERSTSRASDESSPPRPEGGIESKLKRDGSADSKNSKIDTSQLVDLVVEDEVAEEMERVRARKEGGDAWNENEQKHFVRTYSAEGADEGEDIREGFDPAKLKAKNPPPEKAIASDNEDEGESSGGGRYGDLIGQDNVWDSPG